MDRMMQNWRKGPRQCGRSESKKIFEDLVPQGHQVWLTSPIISGNNFAMPFRESGAVERKGRVDFYPVFVGVSSFISGIVNAAKNIPCQLGSRNPDAMECTTPVIDAKTQENIGEDVPDCVISKCEDKMEKLKQMLAAKKVKKRTSVVIPEDMEIIEERKQECRAEAVATTAAIPEPPTTPQTKQKCKKLKNKHKKSENKKPEETSGAPRLKSILKRTDSQTDASHSFDEMRGKFCASDDSFVIVFRDEEPLPAKRRLPSECESEDSFVICFEEPNCFTNEVFSDNDNDDSGSDSDVEEPSNVCLDASLSKTIGDLTDETLYEERPAPVITVSKPQESTPTEKTPKKVTFSCEPPKIRVIRTWAYAHRAARCGPWERAATDRERFKRRIADADLALSWVLKPQHRSRVLFQRIMPWRHAQRRLALAEAKRKREEAERLRKIEEERAKKEEKERALKEEEARILRGYRLQCGNATEEDATADCDRNDCVSGTKISENISKLSSALSAADDALNKLQETIKRVDNNCKSTTNTNGYVPNAKMKSVALLTIQSKVDVLPNGNSDIIINSVTLIR